MPALIFDLDGTLVEAAYRRLAGPDARTDTVYAYVFAWQRALARSDLAIDG
jgi:hypothetical protein